MTSEEAIKIFEERLSVADGYKDYGGVQEYIEAMKNAISALNLISHIKDRPCDACDYNKGNGCTRWGCAFDEHLYGKEKE